MKRLWIAALLLLVGCSYAPERLNGTSDVPPQPSGTSDASPQVNAPQQGNAMQTPTKTIGVVSLIGERFTASYAGWTPLTNTTSDGGISAWGIDQRVATDVASSLGGRFSVMPMSYDPARFGRGIVFRGGHVFVSLPDGSEQPLHQVLGVQPGQLDAVLLVTPSGARTDSGMLAGGLGVLRSRPFFVERTDVYALYRLTLVNAGDDSVINSDYAPGLPDCSRLAGPCRAVSPDLWNANVAQLTPAQVPALQDTVGQLIDASLPAALKGLGLTS